MMASSMHIYSIPECLTDEETCENEGDDWESVSLSEGKESTKAYPGLKYFPYSHRFSSSCNDINLANKDLSKESYYCKKNITSQVSTSLLDFREFYHISDSGTLENDNADLFANAALFNKIPERRFSKPYLKIRDCNSDGNSANEKLLVESFSTVSVPQRSCATSSNRPCMSISDDDSSYEALLPQSSKITTSYQLPGKINSEVIIKNITESRVDTPSKSNSIIENRLGSEKQSLASSEIPYSQQQGCRGRSGSVQWIQNIIQNFDQKCRSFLDLRRPSDIAEEGIRNSNEELEIMDHYNEESTHQNISGVGGGRRYSENVIGKQQQRKFPFSSGFGHLKGLWKDRNPENCKKHDMKDFDQLRPDVCPLFNFPQKSADEAEMILDALRQAMRKCTVADPSARPPSSSVFQQLHQIIK